MGEKRYWLRGGIIVATVYIIIGIIVLLLALFSSQGFIDLGFATVGLAFISELKWLIIPIITGNLILYFLIGAFIGWIYGKIKNRGENNYNEGGMK